MYVKKMKIDLRLSHKLYIGSVAVLMICAVISRFTEKAWIAFAGFAICIAGFAQAIKYHRCPHCGTLVPLKPVHYQRCGHCHNDLDY